MDDNKSRALTDAYKEMAEELRIMYICLKSEGFTDEETMALMTALITKPDTVNDFRRRTTKSHAEMMEDLRKYMNERKARVEGEKENENR